jgi:hypothetical protein
VPGVEAKAKFAVDPISGAVTATAPSSEQLTEPEGEGEDGVGEDAATVTLTAPLSSGVIRIEDAAVVTVIRTEAAAAGG